MDKFLHECEAYCRAAGVSERTLGQYAVGNSKLLPRLRKGGRAWPETLERVRQYMREHPPKREGRAA